MDELLNKYLKLNTKERAEFEKNLKPEQRIELARELGIMESLNREFRKELRSKVDGFETEPHEIRKINPALIGIAASFLLISSLVFHLNDPEPSLFDQYYTAYPNYEVTATRGDNNLSPRQKAYQAYDVADYSAVIEQFEAISKLQISDKFFLGIAYLETAELEKSLKSFAPVISSRDKYYADAALWYSALVQLKLNHTDIAHGLLQRLENGTSEWSQSAADLLSQL